MLASLPHPHRKKEQSNSIYNFIIFQLLTDQADFTVVGILGLQGVGKSTIMSNLHGFSTHGVWISPSLASLDYYLSLSLSQSLFFLKKEYKWFFLMANRF